MGVETNTKNIQALMDHVNDIAMDIEGLKKGLDASARNVQTIDGRVTALHQLIHTALIQTKGGGSTEPDNGD